MKKTKFLSLLLILCFLFTSLSYASDDSSSYLQHSLPKHIQIMKSLDPSFSNYNNISFGSELPVYTVTNGNLISTDVKYVTVYNGGKAIGFVTVSKNEAGEWTSGFGKMFLKRAQDAGIAEFLYNYTLVKSAGKLLAVNKDKSIILNDGIEYSAINIKNIQNVVSQDKKIALKSYSNMNKTTSIKLASTSSSSKLLDVKIVLQNGKPICWAAACAAVINYVKGKSLTAEKISEDMGVPGGATWDVMLRAYNKYGMSPSEYNALSSKSVFAVINSNKPIHMGMVTDSNNGHSTVLRGYTQGVGGDLWYSMIDPNESSYQTLDIPISAQSDGSKVYYVLNGDKFFWKKSRY